MAGLFNFNCFAAASGSPSFGKTPELPLCFEANRGQVAASFRFIARGPECNVLIGPTEAVLALGESADPDGVSPGDRLAFAGRGRFTAHFVHLRLEGSDPQARTSGLRELSGKANYYVGNKPSGWLAGIPLFQQVQIDQVYPGIQLTYHADAAGRLEYDFVVGPGARPDQIRLKIQGADKATLDRQGRLVLKIGPAEIRQHKPVIYQVVEGARKRIPGGYRMISGTEAGFWVGDYDRRLPLVIDPTLSFSEFIGGRKHDRGWGVAVDGDGNVWIAGETLSRDLDTTAGAVASSFQGGRGRFGDAFVARLGQGTNLDYLTYLGGRNQDGAFGVAAGTNDEAFITGFTDSPDFPITNAFQPSLGGTNLNALRSHPIDAFVTKLNPDGTLAYSTYLGGMVRDVGLGIAVDGLDRAYVTGFTESKDFPIVNPLEGLYVYPGGRYDGSVYHRHGDAFVARLSADGAGLEYSTFLGGTNREFGQGIAVDSGFRAYVVGVTSSRDFPVTNAYAPQGYELNQTGRAYTTDGFVSVVDSNGGELAYSSYLGGYHNDAALAVAVDSLSNAYVTGYTYSTNFPETPTGFTNWTSRVHLNADVFVTRFSPDGTTNGGYSVVFGGRLNDQGTGIAVDANQDAYVVGATLSRTNFAGLTDTTPLPAGFSPTNTTIRSLKMTSDFLVALDPGGTNLFAAYLGGSYRDQANGIAFDTNANAAYIVGTTISTNFAGADPATYHGRRPRTEAVISRVQFP